MKIYSIIQLMQTSYCPKGILAMLDSWQIYNVVDIHSLQIEEFTAYTARRVCECAYSSLTPQTKLIWQGEEKCDVLRPKQR